MGKNKLQKFDDMSGYPHVFQYPFAVLREKGFDMKGRWNIDFFKNDNPIVLELGCGKGEYAVGLARKYLRIYGRFGKVISQQKFYRSRYQGSPYVDRGERIA